MRRKQKFRNCSATVSLSSGWKYIARDGDGTVYIYKKKPVRYDVLDFDIEYTDEEFLELNTYDFIIPEIPPGECWKLL